MPYDTGPSLAGGPTFNLDAFSGIEFASLIDTIKASGRSSIWGFTSGGSFNSSPRVKDGTLFLGCNDHCFYALDALSGALRWTFRSSLAQPATIDLVEAGIEKPRAIITLAQDFNAVEESGSKYREGAAGEFGPSAYIQKSQYATKDSYVSKKSGQW